MASAVTTASAISVKMDDVSLCVCPVPSITGGSGDLWWILRRTKYCEFYSSLDKVVDNWNDASHLTSLCCLQSVWLLTGGRGGGYVKIYSNNFSHLYHVRKKEPQMFSLTICKNKSTSPSHVLRNSCMSFIVLMSITLPFCLLARSLQGRPFF